MRPVLFLDRDGVINKDIGYAFRPEQIEWVRDVFVAIRDANQAGYGVVVVTNQSGVARGLYAESDVENLHRWMADEAKKQGAVIDAFYYCPHHPKEGQAAYVQDCMCRKPKPGMLQKAIAAYDADLSRSFLVGDKETDMEAAKAAGIVGHLFTGGSVNGSLAAFIRPFLSA